MKTFADVLSTRSKNGLHRSFGWEVWQNPEHIATAGPERLRMTPQLGPKSLLEIADLLYEFGYIEDGEIWLGS